MAISFVNEEAWLALEAHEAGQLVQASMHLKKSIGMASGNDAKYWETAWLSLGAGLRTSAAMAKLRNYVGPRVARVPYTYADDEVPGDETPGPMKTVNVAHVVADMIMSAEQMAIRAKRALITPADALPGIETFEIRPTKSPTLQLQKMSRAKRPVRGHLFERLIPKRIDPMRPATLLSSSPPLTEKQRARIQLGVAASFHAEQKRIHREHIELAKKHGKSMRPCPCMPCMEKLAKVGKQYAAGGVVGGVLADAKHFNFRIGEVGGEVVLPARHQGKTATAAAFKEALDADQRAHMRDRLREVNCFPNGNFDLKWADGGHNVIWPTDSRSIIVCEMFQAGMFRLAESHKGRGGVLEYDRFVRADIAKDAASPGLSADVHAWIGKIEWVRVWDFRETMEVRFLGGARDIVFKNGPFGKVLYDFIMRAFYFERIAKTNTDCADPFCDYARK